MVKEISFLILAVVLIAGCNQQTTIESCSAYCQEEGYTSGNCFDCVYLDNVELPLECKSDDFLYDDVTWDICTEKKLKDNTQHGCLCSKESGTEKECTTDDDCVIGGCSGTICQSKNAEPIFTTCEYLPEYGCYKEIKCGCIDGKCQWDKTEQFDNCVEEARKQPVKIIS